MDDTDVAIIALRDAGKSLREIGRVVRMSHMAVKKRLDKATREARSPPTNECQCLMHSELRPNRKADK